MSADSTGERMLLKINKTHEFDIKYIYYPITSVF